MKNATMINRMESQWLLFEAESRLLYGSLGFRYVMMEFKGKAFEILMERINRKEGALAVTYLDVLPPLIG